MNTVYQINNFFKPFFILSEKCGLFHKASLLHTRKIAGEAQLEAEVFVFVLIYRRNKKKIAST